MITTNGEMILDGTVNIECAVLDIDSGKTRIVRVGRATKSVVHFQDGAENQAVPSDFYVGGVKAQEIASGNTSELTDKFGNKRTIKLIGVTLNHNYGNPTDLEKWYDGRYLVTKAPQAAVATASVTTKQITFGK